MWSQCSRVLVLRGAEGASSPLEAKLGRDACIHHGRHDSGRVSLVADDDACKNTSACVEHAPYQAVLVEGAERGELSALFRECGKHLEEGGFLVVHAAPVRYDVHSGTRAMLLRDVMRGDPVRIIVLLIDSATGGARGGV